jgi:RNA recognition motif-containing protein
MNIYVGNLNVEVNEEQLRELFQRFGQVQKVRLMKDKYSGVSMGTAFIEMENDRDSMKAISRLNNFNLQGRKIIVNKARPKASVKRNTGEGNW